MKACTFSNNFQCPYQYIWEGTIGMGCSYLAYCDYQLPKDSRDYKLTSNTSPEGLNPKPNLNKKDERN